MKITMPQIPKTLLATLLFLAFITPALQAQYTLTDKDVTIEHGTITSLLRNEIDWGTSDIIIPDTIGGQEVIGIGDDVFSYRDLTSFKLPKTITYIGNGAFSHNGLSEIEIPDKTRFIGKYAFYSNRLTHITIPKSVVYLGRFAFYANSKLDEIIFEQNSSIQIIGGGNPASKQLKKLKFPTNNNKSFTGYFDNTGKIYQPGDEAFLYTPDSNYYFIDASVHTLTKEDVDLIDGEIIRAEPYLNVIMPDSIIGQKITAIGEYAFAGQMIKSIELSDKIDTIKKYAFSYCELTSLRLPVDLKIIGQDAFASNSIDTIIIPNKVTHINNSAFSNNKSKAVVFSKSLTFIGRYAFYDNNFVEIQLPNTLLEIEPDAFASQTLTSLVMLPDPVINEGNIFSFWVNSYGVKVKSISDFGLSYKAIFAPTQSYQVSGTVVTDETSGLLLLLSGDFEGVRAVNDSGTFQFPLNAGRTITVTPNREGYLFFPESITLKNIKTDRTDLYFTSSINDYDVTFTAGENGTITGETFQNRGYKHTTSPVTAVPNSGYKLAAWKDQKGTILSTDNPIVIEVRSDMEVTAVFELVVGVSSINKVALQCFPNPVTNNLTIVAPQNIQKVELYNTLGERVFTQKNINKNTVTLNAAKYIKGVCFVHATGKGFTEVVKVVVE